MLKAIVAKNILGFCIRTLLLFALILWTSGQIDGHISQRDIGIIALTLVTTAALAALLMWLETYVKKLTAPTKEKP